MHYSKITDATLNNLIRKSSYIDEVTFLDNIPLFSWIDINITELCNRKCIFCPRANPDIYPNLNLNMSIKLAEKIGKELSDINYKGVVVFSGWTYELGNLIIIYHGGDYMTHYGHNQKNLVSRLNVVKRGDVIGYVGDTGISSGPHLHFEVWKGDSSIDPLIYFPMYLKKDLTLKK